MSYSMYFDGAISRCSSSKVGCGAVLYDHNKVEITNDSKYLGDNITKNVAEYTGLIVGLHLALKHNVKKLIIYGDSLLIINQMNGLHDIKSNILINLFNDAIKLIKCFEETYFFHIKKVLNKRANELANLKL